MNKSTVIAVIAGVVIGIVLAPQISKLPLVSKIPTL